MGNLPTERINSSFAFQYVGVDYGGPFMIKDKRTRGCKKIKAYICVFVCFSTKAVHLELATDLSTNCFIAVLRRFISRRGKPNTIFSDNSANFIGTKHKLEQLMKFVPKDLEKINNFLSQEEIMWKTIPPRSPHFGGLWESAIKSVKYHLIRVAGNANLVFEEFYTLLTQIEAILNSRPISPMSCDPNDFSPLTPGHFLIGRPLTAIFDEELNININPNRLVRYQRVQQIVQHFWNRWKIEYLAELQTRKKWNHSGSNCLKQGDLVVIQEDNLPPCKWLLGRIIRLIPGSDKVVRVAEIQTNSGVIKRATRRLSVLPIEN